MSFWGSSEGSGVFRFSQRGGGQDGEAWLSTPLCSFLPRDLGSVTSSLWAHVPVCGVWITVLLRVAVSIR